MLLSRVLRLPFWNEASRANETHTRKAFSGILLRGFVNRKEKRGTIGRCRLLYARPEAHERAPEREAATPALPKAPSVHVSNTKWLKWTGAIYSRIPQVKFASANSTRAESFARCSRASAIFLPERTHKCEKTPVVRPEMA